MNYKNDLHRQFHDRLCTEADLRGQRTGFVGDELAWIVREREAMHSAVNRVRVQRGRPPLALHDIERVERKAAGHTDYGPKFALYCEELATA